MTSWYDTYSTDYSDLSQVAEGPDRLYEDAITEKEVVPDMPKFDKDKTLDIIRNGSEEDQRRLVEELSRLFATKRYGLVWERGGSDENSPFEAENVVLEMSSGIPYPVYRGDLSLLNESADKGNNLLLEGDNYIWLKMLEQTHRGKIDVIYIDPPYAGGRGLIYNDTFIDPNDTYCHSKWLSFMESRLSVAKSLLNEDGVIFISIDDDEQAELKILCDDIFGRDNFIGTFMWEKTAHTGKQTKNMYNTGEYILCYAKQLYVTQGQKRLKKTLLCEKIQESFEDAPLYNASNNSRELVFPKGTVSFNIPDGEYSQSNDSKYELVSPVIVTNGINENDLHLKFKSRWQQSTCDEHVSIGGTYIVKTKNFAIRAIYSDQKSATIIAPKQVIMTSPAVATRSRLDENVKTTESGSKLLENIFQGESFDYPKPTSLIKYLVLLKPDAHYVLDFFAGSGTTAQAVEELNQEDEQNQYRKWILVTNNEGQDKDDGDPETGICRDITKPRIDAVISGIRPDGSRYSDGADSGYEYFQYGFIDRDKRQYERNAYRFFQPYIVDALIMLEYQAQKLETDETNMACIYENDETMIISFFADTPADKIIEIVEQHKKDDKPLLLLTTEGASSYNTLKSKYSKTDVTVKYQRSLIKTADYLE